MVASGGNGYGRRPIPLRVSLSPFFSVLAGDFSAPARSEATPAVLTAGGPWQRRQSLAIAMDSDGPLCVTYCKAAVFLGMNHKAL
nr:hypothetical protein Itr_chr03CG01170 [Ipomoea trifida]